MCPEAAKQQKAKTLAYNICSGMAKMKFFKNIFTNKIVFHSLILIAVTAIIYLGNYSNQYSYFDDYQEIIYNPLVNPENPAENIFTDFKTFHFYVPFKHLVNYCINIISPYNPHISHILSDLIHILNVLLCYLVILRISKSYRIAFFTAVFFAGAPVCSNAVNEIAARGHLFTAFFALSSFLAYMFADSSGLKHNQNKHFIALSALLFFTGLFFWPTLIVLPALLLVYEAVKENRESVKKIVLKMLPFVFAAIAVVAVNLYISHLRHSMETQSAVFDNGLIFSLNLFGLESFYKIPALIADYIIYCFIPPFFDIIFAPPLPVFAEMPFMYLGKFAVIAIYIAVCVLIFKKDKKNLIAPAIFVIFLLPGIIFMYKTELISLRYMYTASIGIFFALFVFLEKYFFQSSKNYKKRVAIAVLAVFFAYCAANSFTRKYFWANPHTVTDAMIVNGNIAAVWGWFVKINWEPSLEGKLEYLKIAKTKLEENKYGYDLQYGLINQNIEGRIEYIRQLTSNKE